MARPRTRRAAKESREKAERAVEQAENGELKSSKADLEEAQQPVEDPEEDAPKSEGKRARSRDGSSATLHQEKRQKVRLSCSTCRKLASC